MNSYAYTSNPGQKSGFKFEDFTPDFANFNTSTVRNNFVKKVLSIVAVQMAITTFFIALFTLNEGAVKYAYTNPWLLNIAMISTLGLTLLMAFSQVARRTAPMNLILLGSYTVCQGFLVGVISSMYQVEEVLYAAGLTFAIVTGLAMYASNTKTDFTMKSGMMVSMIMALSMGSLISIFYHGEFFNFMLSVAGAGAFSMYIVYDIQMLMGDRKLNINPEEYIFAALNLYTDIMRIFMELLKILRYLNEAQNDQKKRKRN